MSVFSELRKDAEFTALLALSEALGSDTDQVQGPGGNTSLKRGGAMWVKASGTWLAEARTRDIMVPVDIAAFRAALAAGDPAAENNALDFVPGDDNPGGLRPSIETAVHAVLDWPVVLHTHCVATIATAIRADAEQSVAARLAGMDAVFIPYAKPGIALARAILDRVTPGTRALVLGNHGLVAGGDTVAEAGARLRAVSAALSDGPVTGADPAFVEDLAGSGWRAAASPAAQALAMDAGRIALADGGSLYPDHVIFLGPGVAVARPGEDVAQAAARASADGPVRKLVLVPGQGAVIPQDASPAMELMAGALGDVLLRVPAGTELARLTSAQEADLLNWDAEKYRQALEKGRATHG